MITKTNKKSNQKVCKSIISKSNKMSDRQTGGEPVVVGRPVITYTVLLLKERERERVDIPFPNNINKRYLSLRVG